MMIPVLSTRVFGRLPDRRELALARRAGFLDIAIWAADLPPLPFAQDYARQVHDEGLRVPSVHLPTRFQGRRLDLHAPLAEDRLAMRDAWLRALDAGAALGATVAVGHARAAPSEALAHAIEAANERQIGLALEADTVPGSALPDLLRFLRESAYARGVGLCIDLARTRPAEDELQGLRSRLLWLEAADARGGRRHLPPDDDDEQLRRLVIAADMPLVTYEVVPEGPFGAPPGEAEIALTIRRLAAWHLNQHTWPAHAPP